MRQLSRRSWVLFAPGTQESDKPFVVSLGDDSFYCDEASTGLVANAAMAAIDESLMPSRRKNQLRVKGQESEGWWGGGQPGQP